MGSMNDDDEMITQINVTPLVDVVLVLLVIFMISAPALYQSSIKVDLPTTVTSEKTDKVTLRVSLSQDGSIFLENEKVNDDALDARLEEALKKDPAASAIVAADESLSHGTVMALIDRLKSKGLKRVAIGVQQQTKTQ